MKVYLKHIAYIIKFYLKSNWVNWVVVTEQERERYRHTVKLEKGSKTEAVQAEYENLGGERR